MSKPFVADASVAIAWVHPAQSTEMTDALLDAIGSGVRFEVPALWPLEVANALTVLVRRDRLMAAERDAALAWLGQLRATVDHEAASKAFTKLAALAAEHALSVYDVAYLELAARRGLALACKDGPLRIAATRASIELWTP